MLVLSFFQYDWPILTREFWDQNGITYVAQVLKRNRTLKVLNMSENKLDVQCLVTIAEALVSRLKHNGFLSNNVKDVYRNTILP